MMYVGVTNNIRRRTLEHKSKLNRGYTSKYNIDRLVYFECFIYVNEAIKREKQIKKYSHLKKRQLIESMNPGWNELA